MLGVLRAVVTLEDDYTPRTYYIQMKKSTLLSFDAFAKTEEDVRIRTRSGGFITLGCLVVTLMLLLSEWRDFNSVVTRPELVIDRDRSLRLDLNLDITFTSMPCELLTLDIMDDSGEVQLDIMNAGFEKTRLSKEGKVLGTADMKIGEAAKKDKEAQLAKLGANYCGNCYGARDQGKNNDDTPRDQWVCCQTCDDVRQAYFEKNWAFFDGKDIEQCEREGYVQKIADQLQEGCRVSGSAQLNRIDGNLHFAAGPGFQNIRGHFHDDSLYIQHPNLNFNHIINHLSFGKAVEPTKKGKVMGIEKVTVNPLDGHSMFPPRDAHFLQYSYYAKIVPTRYEGLNKKNMVETAQFSSTFHIRPVGGGSDDDHPNTVHQRGGSPSMWINFEMSPLKVINREEHGQSWSGFVLNCITSIGGVLAVGTVLDKALYKAQRTIFQKKDV